MSDHDFEKQVHQKLRELRLRPSDSVWMEVEKNIRNDKRRRRILWLWLPLLFICLSTSAYVLYRYTSTTKITTGMAQAVPSSSSNTPIAETTKSSNKLTTTIQLESAIGETGNNTRPNSVPVTDSKQPAIGVRDKNNEEKTIGNNNKKPLAAYANDNRPVSQVNSTNLYIREKSGYRKKKATPGSIAMKANEVKQELLVPAEDGQQGSDAMHVAIPVIVNDVDNTIATFKTQKAPFNSKAIHLMMPDSAGNTTAAALPIQRKRPPLWHWGIKTDAGFSRISESKLFQLRGLLGQEKYQAADVIYNNGAADTNSLFNVTSSATAKKASPIQPDLSFSAGVFVQRALSRRFKLSVGIEYSYMSVNTQVGQKVNEPLVINTDPSSAKVVQGYYKLPGYVSSTTGSSSTITNSIRANYQGATYYSQKHKYRFQYIEIPVMANWQINKGRRMPPVVVEGGVSIARLLSVDALHFEGAKGVYYQDNTLFNKTQFNFVTGFSVGLLQHSKHPIWIGPTLSYGLKGMVKKEYSTGQYLWSTGISVKMLLGRL